MLCLKRMMMNRVDYISEHGGEIVKKPFKERVKQLVGRPVVQIIFLSTMGVYLLVASFTPSGMTRYGRTVGPHGADIDPLYAALGIASLVGAWIIYKKWAAKLNKKD